MFPRVYESLPEKLRDRSFALAALKAAPGIFSELPYELASDAEFVLEAARASPLIFDARPDAISLLPQEMQQDRAYWLEAVKVAPRLVEGIGLEDAEQWYERLDKGEGDEERRRTGLGVDRGFMLEAVKVNPEALCFVPAEFAADRQFFAEAVQAAPQAVTMSNKIFFDEDPAIFLEI